MRPLLTCESLWEETLPRPLSTKPFSKVKTLSYFIWLRVGIEPSTISEGSSMTEYRRFPRFEVMPHEMKSLESVLCLKLDKMRTGRRLT